MVRHYLAFYDELTPSAEGSLFLFEFVDILKRLQSVLVNESASLVDMHVLEYVSTVNPTYHS